MINHSEELPLHQRIMTDVITEYALTIGRLYALHGMVLWEGILHFLVADDTDAPLLGPAALFEQTAFRLPAEWSFGLDEGIRTPGARLWGQPHAFWGYPELAHDPNHMSDLSDGDERAVQIFTNHRLSAT